MVAHDLEGQSDQDRREGGEPRPVHHFIIPIGRGRHRTANVPRDLAPHRAATAAATTSAKSTRQKECVQMPEKWPDQTLDQRSGYPR